MSMRGIHFPESHVLRQVRGSERIATALGGVQFPISKQDLILRLGDVSLEFDAELAAPIAELVRGLPQGRFEDATQARRALDARWTRISKNVAAVEEAEQGARRPLE